MYISSYWEKPPSVKKRKRSITKEPCICAVINCEWAIKYERLLRSSIAQGCVELKVINGKPFFGEEEEPPGMQSEKHLPSSPHSPYGPSFDHGEDPLQPYQGPRKVFRQDQTQLQRETLEFLKQARATVSEFPLPEDTIHDPGLYEVTESESSGKKEEGEEGSSTGMGAEEIQEDFMHRMEALEPPQKEEKVTVVISRKIAQIHLEIERQSVMDQIHSFTYPVLPNPQE